MNFHSYPSGFIILPIIEQEFLPLDSNVIYPNPNEPATISLLK
jgi:hypothetical protein